MSYLDPKEQVINLELTCYGKYLLSVGKLKPVYYAFFDDDIIYDHSYAGVTTEAQSEIEPRIQEETPRFSVQPNYSNRELAIFNKNPNVINDLVIGGTFINENSKYEFAVEKGLINVQDQTEKLEVLQNPISFSNPETTFTPAWNVAFLKAPMSSSSDYLTISSSLGERFLNIPQLDANISYQVVRNSRSFNVLNAQGSIQKFGDSAGFTEGGAGQRQGEDSFSLEDEALTFKNGATVNITTDAIILRIEESNVFFEEENFDIELFEVEEVNGKEFLKQVKFYKDLGVLSKDLLNNSINGDSAEYYFDILVDQEIPERVMCPLIKGDKKKQFYASSIFNCEDFISPPDVENIYADADDTGDICN